MWDPVRKMGVLNDFDLAKFADQVGASGTENTGTLPFMALDLLSEDGLDGKIPRLYRHEAEPFTWVLIFLCISTVKNKKGRTYVMITRLLRNWFGEWSICHDARWGFKWKAHDVPDVTFAYPNTKILAKPLHKYWLDRYNRQFQEQMIDDGPSVFTQLFPGFAAPTPAPIAVPPYVEEKEDTVFQNLLAIHEKALRKREELKETWSTLVEMTKGYWVIDWSD